MPCVTRLLRTVALAMAVLSLFASGAAGGKTSPKPPEFVPGSWTLILLPDTQYYSEQYPGVFTLQTHWIAKNKDKYNIRYVLHLGDITNGCTDREWRRAQEAMSELDGKVPYAIVPGNHDPFGMSKYFPISKFRSWPTFGGAMAEDSSENTYHLFNAGGTDWIIIALEWAPRNKTVQWANDVLVKYPDRKAILLTHAYLYVDNTRYDYAKKGKSQQWDPHTCSGKGWYAAKERRQRRRGALAETCPQEQFRPDSQRPCAG